MRAPLDFEKEGELLTVVESLQKLPDPAPREGAIAGLAALIEQEMALPEEQAAQKKPKQSSHLGWVPKRIFVYAASAAVLLVAVAVTMLWQKNPSIEGLPMLPLLELPGEKGGPNEGGTGGPGGGHGPYGGGGGLVLEADWPQVPEKMTVYKKSRTREIREFEFVEDISPSENAVLPDDDQARDLATAFLKEKGLFPDDDFDLSVSISGAVGFIDPVTGKDVEKATAKTVRLRRKINVYPDFSSTASVQISHRNKITMYLFNWPKLTPVGEYPIISPQEAFARLKRGQTIQRDSLNGKIKRIYLAYQSYYEEDQPSSRYLQPVYVFETEPQGSGLMRYAETAMVAAVQDKYVQKDNAEVNQQEKPVDRSRTPKEFPLPEPAKIEEMEKGFKVRRVLTPGDSDFAKYLGHIEQTLIKKQASVGGAGSGTIIGDWLKDSKIGLIVGESGGIHVIFQEKVSISTSLDSEMKLSADKYENFVIETDDFYLFEDRNGGGKVFHLLYDDGKQWTIQTLDLRGNK